MRYTEIDGRERLPKMTANNYFFKVYTTFGHTYGMYHGYRSHMEDHLKENYCGKLVWLEPDDELTDFYQKPD